MKTIRSLEDLTPDPENANAGTKRGADLLGTSLERLGAGRSIVVDRNGVVIAGNKTHEAAVDAGLSARVVQTTGGELVVVQRMDLDLSDGGRARELAYADNRVGEVGLQWDASQIVADYQSGNVPLDLYYFPEELVLLLEKQLAAEIEGQQARPVEVAGAVAGSCLLTFETPADASRWERFMEWLRRAHPQCRTDAQRLLAFIEDYE